MSGRDKLLCLYNAFYRRAILLLEFCSFLTFILILKTLVERAIQTIKGKEPNFSVFAGFQTAAFIIDTKR